MLISYDLAPALELISFPVTVARAIADEARVNHLIGYLDLIKSFDIVHFYGLSSVKLED